MGVLVAQPIYAGASKHGSSPPVLALDLSLPSPFLILVWHVFTSFMSWTFNQYKAEAKMTMLAKEQLLWITLLFTWQKVVQYDYGFLEFWLWYTSVQLSLWKDCSVSVKHLNW